MPPDAVKTYLPIIVAVLLSCTTNSALGKTQRHDADETTTALAALFRASEERFVLGSSCDVTYYPPGSNPLTVGFLMAAVLANLDVGKNTIYGSCKGNKCSVEIYHAYGEDVSSVVIRFRIKNGKARVETMECRLTP